MEREREREGGEREVGFCFEEWEVGVERRETKVESDLCPLSSSLSRFSFFASSNSPLPLGCCGCSDVSCLRSGEDTVIDSPRRGGTRRGRRRAEEEGRSGVARRRSRHCPRRQGHRRCCSSRGPAARRAAAAGPRRGRAGRRCRPRRRRHAEGEAHRRGPSSGSTRERERKTPKE